MKPTAVLAHLACTSAVALAPALAAAQVDPSQSFYAIAFTHGAPHTGVITAQRSTAPFDVVATAARGTANGAITFDPVRSLLYGGACCAANPPLQAYDPVTLARVPTRDLTLTSSGSMAFEVDGPRRVLFHYDTVTRALRAVSLAESNYGAVVATTTLSALPAEPGPTSVGDQLAVDTRAQRVVVTGGDGGPVLTVDISNISATVGAFGAVVDTGHVNRTTGNSAGAVAVDEVGRRIFFIPTDGTVRVVSADAPFTRLADIAIPSMSGNDCGLFYDGRTSNLYVGRGSTVQPVVVSFPTMAVTPFATGPGEVVALSFAAPTTGCVDRDGDGFPSADCAPAGARTDCDDTRREVNPDAAETCDARDNNCNAFTDEGFCRIDGMCVAHDAVNPANACQRCVAPLTASAATGWGNRPALTVCRPAAGPCDLAETCDGAGAPCPSDGLALSTAVCRPAAGTCDAPEMCTGMSAACPDDVFAAAETVCRVSTSIAACDPAERCTGMSDACPNDTVTRAPTTEVCNGEDDDCDGMTDEPPCVPMPDAGPDASADVEDASEFVPDVPRDQTPEPPVDVAPPMDAMVPPPDAMAPPPDAMQPPPDAPTPNQDAATADTGTGSGANDGGCGCATPGSSPRAGSWLLVALAGVALGARRRTRRTR